MTGRRRRFFLVERYIPSISSSTVESAVGRLSRPEPGAARHLYTVLVSEEETCLSLFEAPDPQAVAAANERASFALDRIVEVELFGESTPIRKPQHTKSPL